MIIEEFAAKEKLEIVASFQEVKTVKEPVKNIGSTIFCLSRSETKFLLLG